MSTLRAPVINHTVNISPRLKLSLPVGDGGERRNDQEGTDDSGASHFFQKSNGLDGFAQTHFISKDAVLSVIKPD